MNSLIRRLAVAGTLMLAATAAHGQRYELGPDSKPQPGVPQGSLTQHAWNESKIYPGTFRDYWIYVPAQYDPATPAPVMVFQDGGGFVSETGAYHAPTVLDNLIHQGDIPPLIGVFIDPGKRAADESPEHGPTNRSFEYDALGDRYARFLLEEILPEVGKSYNLTADPNARAIAGDSSGGICSFTVAWERPDAFRRVLSHIGSFTNLRGGQIYPSLIRKTEPKPIRVLIQDGSNDLSLFAGDWWIANQDMASALEYAGYDVKFVTGVEGHNSFHQASILPASLRWLWRDYPEPVRKSTAAVGYYHQVNRFLSPQHDWEEVASGFGFSEGPAIDAHGNLFFTDIPNNRIHKLAPDGSVSVFQEDTQGANGLMFGPDGRLYACQMRGRRVVAYDVDGQETVLAEDVRPNDLVVTPAGEIYFTEPPEGQVSFIDKAGNKRVVHKGMNSPNGVILSPDGSTLVVGDYAEKWAWSFQIQPDGGLANGQPLYRFEVPDQSSRSDADGLAMTRDGHLLAATVVGLQICDQLGRVVAIVNKPQQSALSNVVFGGPNLDTIYVTAGDKLFKRKTRMKGFLPWEVGRK